MIVQEYSVKASQPDIKIVSLRRHSFSYSHSNFYEYFTKKAQNYLEFLCSVKPNRRTGSSGNYHATSFFAKKIEDFGKFKRDESGKKIRL